MIATTRIKVAVGILWDNQGQLMITQRRDEPLWEFPGGKVEAGESSFDCLRRELAEEINIDVQAARAWMQLDFDYPAKSVTLDIWQIDHYQGKAYGKEGQAYRWVPVEILHQYPFLAANQSIITRLQAAPIHRPRCPIHP